MTPVNLDGRPLAVVTGAHGGIGSLLVDRLANEGWDVLSVVRSACGPVGAAAPSAAPGTREICFDLGHDEDFERLRAEIEARGRGRQLRLLVNAAAVWHCRRLKDTGFAELRQQLRVNLEAPILLTRALLPILVGPAPATVVNIASVPGRQAMTHHVAYGASKAGLINATHALAAEWRGTNVTARVVIPTAVRDRGMTARAGGRPPWSAGAVTAAEVVDAVLGAVRSGRLEVLVCRNPTLRPLFALGAMFPRLGLRLVGWLGVDRYHEELGRRRHSGAHQ